MATITLPRPGATTTPSRVESLKVARRHLAARILRRRVHSRDFSIISNDCWGGMAYEELAARYETPFIGLFVLPQDYLRLLQNLRSCLDAPLKFRPDSRHAEINQWRAEIRREYPIGVLPEDVELHFLHYRSTEDAAAKWARRTARINWRKLRIKISWQEHPEIEGLLREFDALPYDAKISLAPRPVAGTRCCVALQDFSTDGTQQYYRCHKAFDVAQFLDGGRIERDGWMRVLNWVLYWRY